MVCPLNYDKTLQGDDKVRAALKALTSPPKQSEIKDAIRYQLTTYPTYYAKAYPQIQGLSIDNAVEVFFSNHRKTEGRVVGTNIVSNGKIIPLFPKGQQVTNNKSTKLVQVLTNLQELFNFPYVIISDPEFKFKGKYLNINGQKTVVINAAYATDDTPFHEYYHPFVRLMKDNDPELFDLIQKEASFIKGDREEAVTEYLGKVAASTYRTSAFQRFIDYVSSLIAKYLGINFQLSPSDTVKDVVNKLLTEGYDVAEEQSLEEAYQLLSTIDGKTGVLSKQDRRDVNFLSRLKDLGKKLTTSDTSEFYQVDGQDAYRRITSFSASKTNGEFTFLYPNRKSRDANQRAMDLFASKGIAITEKIKLQNEEYTFDQMVEYFEQQEKMPSIRGKMIHAYIESLSKTGDERKDALVRTEEFAAQLGTPYMDITKHPDLKAITEDWDLIKQKAGIVQGDNASKYDDKVESEIVLFSDILTDKNGKKLASTADAVVYKYNGDVGLVDYKSGNILSDYNSAMLMPYAASYGVKDSKLNHGFLELALRAIMIKEQNPDTKFSFIRIVKVDKYGQHEVFDADLGLYLNILGDYYRKTNPTAYEALVAKGLLDVNNYSGTSMASNSYMNLIEGKSRDESIAIIDAKLAEYQAMPYQGKQPEYIAQEIKILSEIRLELEGFTDIKVDLTNDKNSLSAALSTLSDIDKKSVKGLNNLIIKARDKQTKERAQVFSTWDTLLQNLYKERPNYGNKGVKLANKLITANLAYGVATLNLPWIGVTLAAAYFVRRANTSTKETFAFMYNETPDGIFLNTSDSHDGRKLTKAEKELRDYYITTLKQLYADSMKEVVDVKYGRPVTKAEAMRMPEVMPDDFVVRVPKSLDETREDANVLKDFFGIKSYAETTVKSNIMSVIERNAFVNQKEGVFYPVKNFHTSGKIVEGKMHSLNPDLGFKIMAENLMHKKHFDPLYPVAQGVRNIIADATTPDGKAALPNILSALDSHITMQIENKEKEVRYSTAPQTIDFTTKIGKYWAKLLGVPQGTYELNQDKILRSLRTGLGFTTMAFKTFSAVKNFAIISLTNGIKLSSSYVGKLYGVKTDEDDFTKAAIMANKDMVNYWKDWFTDNKHNNKLHLLAERFDWMPDNSAYGRAKNNLFVDITKPTIGGTAYMFHNFVETYGALTHLSAALRSTFIMVNGKKTSLYDAYKVENGELVWKGGLRGYNTLGEELTELDAMEIKSFKRAYERTQGSYRGEEKTALEVNIYGQFVMQFKKYFYTYVKNQVMSEMEDPTIGRYIEVKDITRPDGFTTFQWEQEVMKGRLSTFFAGAVALAKRDKNFLEGKRGQGNKRRLAELTATGFWFALLMYFFVGFDDDDESPREKLYADAIKDSTGGIHWKDYISTATSPVVLLSRGAQISKALLQLMGLEKDTRNQAKRTLTRTIPVFSNKTMLNELISNSNLQDPESLFGYFIPESTNR